VPASDPIPIACDAGTLADPDLGTVEALARGQLAARRLGYQLRLYNVPAELNDLLELVGLADVLPRDELRVEAGREPEEREQRVRVEEEAELGDPGG
jgi:hypothetical protein